jgi:hypothetical protein
LKILGLLAPAGRRKRRGGNDDLEEGDAGAGGARGRKRKDRDEYVDCDIQCILCFLLLMFDSLSFLFFFEQ